MDLLNYEADHVADIPPPSADVEEVSNYLDALNFTRNQISDPTGLPLSLRLLPQALSDFEQYIHCNVWILADDTPPVGLAAFPGEPRTLSLNPRILRTIPRGAILVASIPLGAFAFPSLSGL